jgi:hypothetical protein
MARLLTIDWWSTGPGKLASLAKVKETAEDLVLLEGPGLLAGQCEEL